MKVKELIEALQKLNVDKDIEFYGDVFWTNADSYQIDVLGSLGKAELDGDLYTLELEVIFIDGNPIGRINKHFIS
jgi:hypothetical protein